MKTLSKNTVNNQNVCKCSRSHKIWSVVALAGLFACGLFVGLGFKSADKKIMMGAQECDAVAQEIFNLTVAGVNEENINTLRDLNKAYENGCQGRVVIFERDAVAPNNAEQTGIVSTCVRIEQLLKTRLRPEDSMDYFVHMNNADTYATLYEKGCAENAEMYKSMAVREMDIADAIGDGRAQLDLDRFMNLYDRIDMSEEAETLRQKIKSSPFYLDITSDMIEVKYE